MEASLRGVAPAREHARMWTDGRSALQQRVPAREGLSVFMLLCLEHS